VSLNKEGKSWKVGKKKKHANVCPKPQKIQSSFLQQLKVIDATTNFELCGV